MSISVPSFETIKSWLVGFLPIMKRLWNDYINGPTIGVKLLDPTDHLMNGEKYGLIYTLEVRNTRGAVVIPGVYISGMTDQNGRFLGVIKRPREIPIRDGNGGIVKPRLFGNASEAIDFLYIRRDDSGEYVSVFVVNRYDGQIEIDQFSLLNPKWPHTANLPKQFILSLRIVFHAVDDPDREVIDKEFHLFVDVQSQEPKVGIVPSRKSAFFD